MNEKEEQVEKVYNMLKGKENRFSKDELERLIVFDGYDKDIAKRVVKKLYDNKPKEEKPITTTPQEKEKILAEISKSLKGGSEEKPPLVAPKKDNKRIFSIIGNFFKKIYFFFEDIYYSMIDGINKFIPISKLVDGIDKVFPSFILFLIFIIAIIWLIFFSGVFGGLLGSPVLEITVTDSLDMPISGATAILSIGDLNKTSQTDVFGETIFQDFGKKKDVKLIIQKESYNTQTKELKLKNGNNSVVVKLDIDTTTQLHLLAARTRNLVFKENDILLATRPILVNLRCANSGTIPEPNSTSINSGQLPVNIPTGCGDLRVDVSSEYYNSIQNTLVPENNVIMLTPIAQNYGTLEITVRDQNTQAAISDVFLQLYKPDDPTTQINESNLVVSSGTTTVYGTYVFTNLTPGAYTVSANKSGYTSSLNRFGPYQISINNNTIGNIILSTGGKTLNVVLVDINGNTEREIKGDITVYTKRTDTNVVTAIGTREDTNRATFSLPVNSSGVTYKLAVQNTENSGYYAPDIMDLNYFDNNTTITIQLEYSSALNTGKIGVNVSRSTYKVVGASVYIFRENHDDIPIAGPHITNSSGDCNFSLIRSGRKYFAYAIKSPEQGVSEVKKLDANDYMELNVELEDQATILNLKVMPTIDYNILFFKSNGDEVTEFVVTNTSQDSNKEYIFRDSAYNMYAIISANGKATYQTSLITLIPGQRIYRSVSLSNTRTEAFSNIELLGIYDESGNIDKNIINLATDYSKTFKLKFKLTTINQENRDKSYAYIRAGKRVALPSDYLRLENVIAFETENEYGCNFSGETTDWNQVHFLAYDDIDHSQANCSASPSGFKWVKIDFSDSDAEQIEFFVDFKFQNGITNLSDYIIYYKSLTETEDEEYKLSPNLSNSWQECDMIPEGYFYSPYYNRALTFDNSDYAFLYDIYDYNSATNTIGQRLSLLGSKYILEIGNNYNYAQKMLYLKNSSANGSILATSYNTYNHLLYNAYKLKIRNQSSNTQTDINVTGINVVNYTIFDIDASLATQIDHNSVFTPIDFFINYSTGGSNQNSNSINQNNNSNQGNIAGMASATLNPQENGTNYDLNTDSNLATNLLNISGLNPYSVPVLAYYPADANVIIEIITGDATGNNDIYAGDNNISFRVRNISGSPISGVRISSTVYSPQAIIFGTTNSNGLLSNKNLSLPLSKLGSSINFSFLFPANFGFSNNTVVISKQIKSSYRLFLEDGTEISQGNAIQYNVGRYMNNGQLKFTKAEKNYYIKGTNQVSGRLIAADPYPNPTQYLDFQDINNYIYTENNVPLYLSDLNKEIKTRISILNFPNLDDNTNPLQDPKGQSQNNTIQNKLENAEYTSVTGGYHNIINAGNYNNLPIRLDLNAPFNTNLLFNLNLETSFVGLPKPGVKESTEGAYDLIIELIKNRHSNINFNMAIANGSDNRLLVDAIPVIDSSLNGYITVTTNDINIPSRSGNQLSIAIDLNNSKIITSDLRNKPLIINLNYTINGVTFTEPISIKINVYDSNDAFVINQPTIKTMDCTANDCNTEIVVSATNKTRTYDFNLSSINVLQPDNNLSITVSPPLPPIIINSQQTDNIKEITLKVSGNYNLLKGNTSGSEYMRVIQEEITKTIKYNYKIIGSMEVGLTNQNFDINKNTNFKISIWLQNIQELLRENGLYGNICLGVGGININQPTGFYILGNCDTEGQNDCKNGADAKPKIIYDWSDQTDWKTECIENTSEDYNEQKTHCDSLQMLFSVFKLIENSTRNDISGNKFIYLMSDGVTKDLLSDFVNNTEFMYSASTNWDNQDLLSDANIDANRFSISKTEIDSAGNEITTLKPGKYKITIENFIKGKPNPLHIKLELVREMPYTMRNLLYYLPIDGDLGIIGNNEQNKRSARDGYGSSLTQSSKKGLPVEIGTGASQKEYYIYPIVNDENKSRAIINLQNDSNNFKNTLRSEGKLLDLALTNIDSSDQSFNINMTYSPSYPIPLYAKVVNSDVSGLSYKLKKDEINDVAINFTNFLVWQDYSNENRILSDGQYYSGVGVYYKSMIDGLKFKSVYGENNQIKLLKTMMYWPMNYYAGDIPNINLVLSDNGSNCCGNNPESKIYSLVNLNGSSTNVGNIKNITRANSTLGTVDLKDLLDYIDNNACIRSGLTVTTIKWIDENVGFTPEQANQIIENSGVSGINDNPTNEIIN
jgi:hypothetical protein